MCACGLTYPMYCYLVQMVGMLNFDIWLWITGFLVDDLRISRDFHHFPDVSSPSLYCIYISHLSFSILPLLPSTLNLLPQPFLLLIQNHNLMCCHFCNEGEKDDFPIILYVWWGRQGWCKGSLWAQGVRLPTSTYPRWMLLLIMCRWWLIWWCVVFSLLLC